MRNAVIYGCSSRITKVALGSLSVRKRSRRTLVDTKNLLPPTVEFVYSARRVFYFVPGTHSGIISFNLFQNCSPVLARNRSNSPSITCPQSGTTSHKRGLDARATKINGVRTSGAFLGETITPDRRGSGFLNRGSTLQTYIPSI